MEEKEIKERVDVAPQSQEREDAESGNNAATLLSEPESVETDDSGAKQEMEKIENSNQSEISAKEFKSEENLVSKEEYDRNYRESMQMLEGYRIGRNMTREDLDTALEFITEIGKSLQNGKIGIELVEMAVKAHGYDRDIALAREKGLVSGRNSRIEELLAHEQSAHDASGAPRLPGTAMNGNSQRSRHSIFSLADQAR